jgi:inorganic pyrophosphatase
VSNLAAMDNKWNPKKKECKVIIETPKGRRNKFDYDPEFELFTLATLLPEGLAFPYDFGFIPSTLGEDGDPLDVLVLMDEPAHVGCLLDVRLIGNMAARQTEDGRTTRNDRLIGVAIKSFSHQAVFDVKQIPKERFDQVEEFFIAYNKSRGKKFKVQSLGGPKDAVQAVETGIKAFQANNPAPKK